MHILDTIISHKRDEVKRLKRDGIPVPPEESLPKRGLLKALSTPPHPAIIAEVKKASPSKGIIVEDFRPADMAHRFQDLGARAISILTDERFFQGSLEYLYSVRSSVRLPCLRKDFIIDHVQVKEAHIWGADAILLIVAVLEGTLLKELLHHARECGMDALVEVHNEREAEAALDAGARIIGINNRDLRDFSVSLETTFRVKEALGGHCLVVSESGIKSVDAILRLKENGVHGALIGESIMRDPGLLGQFVQAVEVPK